MTLIVIVLKIFNKIPYLTFNGAIVALLVAIASSYFQKQKNEHQTALITITAKYLLERETSYVDEILGTLISGKFTKIKIDAIAEFFECLQSICNGKDFEMRRRVAEALPALFQINMEKSMNIFEILRRDWDKRWKDDNRRRAIESLNSIIDEDKKFVIGNINIIDNDRIFTVIALTEILSCCVKHAKLEDIKFSKLLEDMHYRKFGSDEIESIEELWNLRKLISKDIKSALDKCNLLKDNTNEYIQICVARNIKFFCKKFSVSTLNLMEYFINQTMPKNVRRPIAKEDNLDCLISLCKDKECSSRAQSVIWKLMTDDDEIIRLAAFDKIEKIISIDEELGKRILVHIINYNHNSTLVQRAKNLLKKSKHI